MRQDSKVETGLKLREFSSPMARNRKSGTQSKFPRKRFIPFRRNGRAEHGQAMVSRVAGGRRAGQLGDAMGRGLVRAHVVRVLCLADVLQVRTLAANLVLVQ